MVIIRHPFDVYPLLFSNLYEHVYAPNICKIENLKRIILLSFIIIALPSCALNTKIKSDFELTADSSDSSLNTILNPEYRIAVIADSPKDREFAECVQNGLESRLKKSTIITEESFRAETFPWVQLCDRPYDKADVYEVLSIPQISQKLEDIGLDFIIYVSGSTKWDESGWIGGGEFIILGYAQKERKTRISVTVVDVNKSKLLGNAFVRSEGIIAIPVFMLFVPIPMGLATETSACSQTAEHIANSLVRKSLYSENVVEDSNEEGNVDENASEKIAKERANKYLIDELKKSAIKGIAKDQYSLGLLYYQGNRVLQDFNETFKWWFKAAQQGYADAQYGLGMMYYEGKGILDQREAVLWLKKAAEQGHFEATKSLTLYDKGIKNLSFEIPLKNPDVDLIQRPQKITDELKINDARGMYRSGLKYESGDGVPQDYLEAANWFRKAADLEYEPAQFSLGLLYNYGKGVPKDCSEAMKWYHKAADLEYPLAQYKLGIEYDWGICVPQDYAEAAHWYRKAAEQGEAEAQYNLGKMYYDGRGVQKDYSEAMKWYLKAAEQGDTKAQFNIAVMYNNGQGVLKNQKEAATWFKKAAVRGHSLANQKLLSIANEEHNPVQSEFGDFERYMEAAKKGDVSAQHEVASRYHKGIGVTQDYQQALKWFKRASKNGNADSIFEVSEMYYWGEGLPRDKREAGEWCLKAANLGHGKAECAMGLRYSEIVGSQSYWGSKIDEYKWLRLCSQNKEIPQGERNKAYLNLTRLKSRFSEGTLEYAETKVSERERTNLEESQHYEEKVNDAWDLNRLGQYKYYQAYNEQGQAREDLYKEAAELLLKASEQGNTFAQERLSQMYYDGKGVTRDFEKASMWLEESAGKSSAYEQYEIGQKFRKGIEFPYSITEAHKWYLKAARKGHSGAQYRLGRIYGESFKYLDRVEAVKWFTFAAEQNHSTAQYYLAKSYHYGIGIEPDYEEAWRWYSAAIKNGNRHAQEWLDKLCSENVTICEKMSSKAYKQGHAKKDSYQEDLVSCSEIAGNYKASATDNCGGRKLTSDIAVKVTGDCSFIARAHDNGLITKGKLTTKSGKNYGGNATNKAGCGKMDLNCTVNTSSFTCNYSYTNGTQGTIFSKEKL